MDHLDYPRGFDGLSLMVSTVDLSALRSEAEREGLKQRETHAAMQPAKARAMPQRTGESRRPQRVSWGTRALVGAIITLILSALALNQSGSSSDSRDETVPVDTGSLVASSGPDNGTINFDSLLAATNQEASDTNSSGNNPGLDTDTLNSDVSPYNSSVQSLDATVPATVDASSETTDESVPAVGRGRILTSSEIRYCAAERVRLQGADKVLDNTLQSDIDSYNAMINDYNDRCGDYRYQRSARQRVLSEIESRRTELEAAGAARFR